MPDRNQTIHSQRRSRTIVRTITIGGKFTPIEYEELSKIASDNGQLLSEWAREVLLREGTSTSSMSRVSPAPTKCAISFRDSVPATAFS